MGLQQIDRINIERHGENVAVTYIGNCYERRIECSLYEFKAIIADDTFLTERYQISGDTSWKNYMAWLVADIKKRIRLH